MMNYWKIKEDKNAKLISTCDCGVVHAYPLSDYALMNQTNKPVLIICGNCGKILVQSVDEHGRPVRIYDTQNIGAFKAFRLMQSIFDTVDTSTIFQAACKVYWSRGYCVLWTDKRKDKYGNYKLYDNPAFLEPDCRFIDEDSLRQDMPEEVFKAFYEYRGGRNFFSRSKEQSNNQ